ncbi:hypothetical protein NQ317_004204 [Molorchus minor]|uniref:Endonuclease-reverse transcriptase n=1 Tax=Molorchus minor TaxID=1323400 RepID=A0ABQ9IXP7_9CUCU|nr:hypothetical protein NQ317_004204 [Molorchus minor]
MLSQDISNKIDGLEGKLKNIEQKYDTTIAELEQKAQTFEIENIELRKRLIDVERKLKRKNLIFYGIVEEIGENVVNVLRKIIEDKLKVKLEIYDVKKEIIKNRRNLKGSNIYISEDQTTEDRKERKVLVEHLKLARSKNKLAQLKGNKLVIDGEIYVYADLEHKEHDGYYCPPPTREASSAPATPSLNIENTELSKENQIYTFPTDLTKRACEYSGTRKKPWKEKRDQK